MAESLFDLPATAHPYLETFTCGMTDTGELDYYFACNVCERRVDDGPCADHAPLNVPGLQLADCDTEPRHPHTFFHASDAYPPPCMYCVSQSQQEQIDRLTACRHWPWRRWKLSGRIASWLYALGLVAGYGFTNSSTCHGCLCSFRFGNSSYLLGWPRWKWNCLLREHHWPGEFIGMNSCTKCYPCPDCGSRTSCYWGCTAKPSEVTR